MAESMAQFVARRLRETSRFGRAAEAAAHEAYGRAIRAGEDLSLPTARDVVDYGAAVLRRRGQRAPAPQLNRSLTGKKVAGVVAEKVGNVVGVGRGAVHAAQGLGEGAVFLGRLAARDRRAWNQLGQAGGAAIDYAGRAVSDPTKVVRDINAKARQMSVDLDPRMTPEAATIEEELRRRFEIGQNQGELAFDVGAAAVGGPLAKGVKGLAHVPGAVTAERYIAQGAKPATAAYLAEPYPLTGKGSHWIPQRAPLPRAYLDSEFNVLRPSGITRGEMYEQHYKIDDHFHGARLPGELGEHWSGRRLGLERYGPLERAWHGTPAPLKARIGGLGATAGGLAHDPSGEDEGW